MPIQVLCLFYDHLFTFWILAPYQIYKYFLTFYRFYFHCDCVLRCAKIFNFVIVLFVYFWFCGLWNYCQIKYHETSLLCFLLGGSNVWFLNVCLFFLIKEECTKKKETTNLVCIMKLNSNVFWQWLELFYTFCLSDHGYDN